MSKSTTPTKEDSALRAPAQQLVEHFVGFVKTMFMYPDTNPRAVEAVQRISESRNAVSKFNESVTLALRGDKVRVGKLVLENGSAANKWLHDAFVKTNLGGLKLKPEVDRTGLTAFAKLLRTNLGKPKATFAQLWTTQVPGLVFIEMVFDGEHGEVGIADDSAPSEETVAHDGLRAEAKQLIAQWTKLSSNLRERLQDVQKMLRVPVNPETASADWLLYQVVGLLPAEVVRDENLAQAFVERIIEETTSQVVGMVFGQKQDFDTQLARLTATVAKRYFGVLAFPKDPLPKEGLPDGRPGDEKITDDLAELLQTWERLPRYPEPRLESALEDIDREMVGICLHVLVNADSESTIHLATTRLLQWLRGSGGKYSSQVTAYLEKCFAEKSGGQKHRRVLELLQKHEMNDVLEGSGQLDVDVVSFTFPDRFFLFLDMLDERDEKSMKQLKDISFAVGPDRIAKAAPSLLVENGLLTPKRVQKLLRYPHDDLLPLVLMVAEHGETWVRGGVAQFLRHLDLPSAESAALRVVDPPSLLPSNYLVELIQGQLVREFPSRVRDLSGRVVRMYIQDIASDPAQHERRLYAIRGLRNLGSPETVTLLKELRRAGGRLFVSKTARAVRQAAEETLKALGAK